MQTVHSTSLRRLSATAGVAALLTVFAAPAAAADQIETIVVTAPAP